jgi:type I restriction enzyme S subunit
MTDWRRSTWGDEISLEYGKGIRGYADGKGPIRVFGTNGPVGWTDQPLANGPGVILGRKGAYRGVHYSPDPFYVIDTAYYAMPNSPLIMRWLYYAMIFHELGLIDDGSPIPSTTRAAVYPRELLVPSPDEQRAIADVLGSLDDKIEQNRRTGRKLESLARAVFKAWFVDFEPVKAKAAGATDFPGMPAAAFAALPTRLTDSELGPVPEGWEIQAVSEAFEVNPLRKLAKGVDAAYLDMKNMPTSGHAPEAWERREVGSGMKFINGDTLVARITPCLENGKTAFVDFLEDGEVACGSTEYIVLRPKPPLPPVFAYCLARTNPFRDFAVQNMSGTSGRQRVAASAMEHYRLAVPRTSIAKTFGDLVMPLFESVGAGMNESCKLATLRDYLLPRLLSGRVRVFERREFRCQ